MGTTRNASFDYLRFAGAAGIVVFHMQMPYANIGLAALHMFVILTVYFGARKTVSDHLWRLLLPWVIWSLIYGAMKAAQAVVEGHRIAAEFEPWMLIAGTSIHLWFLTFCAAYFAIFLPLKKRLPSQIWLIVSVVVFLASIAAANTIDVARPFAQWITVLPAAILGHNLASQKLNTLGVCVIATVLAALWWLGCDQVSGQLLIAISVFRLGMSLKTKETKLSQFCASTAFGVYLVHPAVMAVVAYGMPLRSWLAFAVVIVASTMLTIMLKRSRRGRFETP